MADPAAARALELVTRLSKEVAKIRDRLGVAEVSLKRIETALAPKTPKSPMTREQALINKRRAMAEAMKFRWKGHTKTPSKSPPEPAPKKRRRKKRPPS